MALRFGLIGCGDFGKHLARYLLEVAYRSAQLGGRPVELPLYPELEER